MNKLTLIAAVALYISGCASPPPKVWLKGGATAEQTNRDHMSCQQHGMESTKFKGLYGTMLQELSFNNETDKCMVNLGYQQR